jgi:hypothetical protein
VSRRRWIGWSALAVVLLGAAALAWIAVTAVIARHDLDQARSAISGLRSDVLAGDVESAERTAKVIDQKSAKAHRLTTGPAWALAAYVPYLGAPLRTVRGSTAQIHVVATQVIEPLAAVAGSLDPKRLFTSGGHVDAAALAIAAPVLAHASLASAQARRAIGRLPSHTWLGTADKARNSLVKQLDQIDGTLSIGARTVAFAPTLLGQRTPQRYFVGLVNTAEARGVGGVPGAFVILVADKGTLKITHYESDSVLNNVSAGIDLGAEYDARYSSADPTSVYPNSTISPHFPDAARIWAAMWTKYSGERIDGAISIDPTALSYLLEATGPATTANGETVSAGSVVALTQQLAYSRYPDNTKRKAFLIEVTKAVDDKILLGGAANSTAFVKQAIKAVDERRILLWTSNASIETQLNGAPISGALTQTSQPFALMSVTNAAGGKLDYYLDRSMSWRSSACSGGLRTVTVTMTLTNGAPTGLPAYVDFRADKPTGPVKPGDNRLLLNYFATHGAALKSVTLDGTASTAQVGIERTHPVYTLDVELPRGATRTVVLTLSEPGTGAPTVIEQPLVRPIAVSVNAATC